MSAAALEQILLTRVPQGARSWFADALSSCAGGGVTSDGFAVAWSGCGRRLGRVAVALEPAETEALADGPFVPNGWGLDEAGRALLVRKAVQGQPEADLGAAIMGLFQSSEMREQQALLRVLVYLPNPSVYAPVAAEAVRSNVLSVVEALACENPFPAVHMPDLAFNHLVMKSIFNAIPLSRMVGLAERKNAELLRMVGSFASERRAAGRPVPKDVDLILGGPEHASV